MDIIIGAGVSGIAYANFTNNQYLILEKDSQIGGFCRTIKKSGFVWDYSGHFFHFRNKDIEEFVCKNIALDKLFNTKKITQIYYKGRYIDFPFQSNIHQLDQQEFIDCLYDLFTTNPMAETTTFKEFIYNNLGKSIAEKFLVPYNEKLYACDLNTLDSGAMGRFFPKVSREDIVRNFKNSSYNSYNATFTYPRTGAIEYVDSMMANLNQGNLKTETNIVEINYEKKTITTSLGEIIAYDNLISTMPFPELLKKCDIKFDSSIYTCNKVLVFNLGFDTKGSDIRNCWVYFPEKEFVFYRVGYYDNIIPSDRMSLYVEIGFKENETITDTEKILKRVLTDLTKAGIITNQKLVDYHNVVMNPAYVHINKRHLEDIKRQKHILAQHNIYSIGRYGSWTYCSIEDNIIEAKDLAEQLNK